MTMEWLNTQRQKHTKNGRWDSKDCRLPNYGHFLATRHMKRMAIPLDEIPMSVIITRISDRKQDKEPCLIFNGHKLNCVSCLNWLNSSFEFPLIDTFGASLMSSLNIHKKQAHYNYHPPEEENIPPSQRYVVMATTSIFLIYFCILREENDVDENLYKPLFETVPHLEIPMLEAAIAEHIRGGRPYKDMEDRLIFLKSQPTNEPPKVGK